MEFYLGILLGLVALIAIVWAFVRSRVGDEPHCRGCGFSLAGLTDPKVCPECGRSLSRRRAVVVGERRSRKKLVVVFLVLGGLSSALLWLDGANRRGFIPVNEYKPGWMLMHEAYLLDDQRASIATDEIIGRIMSGELPADYKGKLLSIALRRHAQTWRSFPDSQWGVITHAISRGEFSIEQCERVWDDVVQSVVLRVPESGVIRCYPGEVQEISWGINFRAGALGAVVFPLDISTEVHATDTDVAQSDVLGRVTVRGPIIQSVRTPSVPGLDPDRPDQLMVFHPSMPTQVGTYRGQIKGEMQCVMHIFGAYLPGMSQEDQDRLSQLSKSFEIPFTIEVVPYGTDGPPVVKPGLLADDPRDLLEFKVVRAWNAADGDGTPGVMYTLRTTQSMDPSVGLGGMLVFEQNGEEIRTTTDYAGHNKPFQSFMVLEGFIEGEVRVSYEYDEANASQHRRLMDRVLGGRVELGVFELPGVPDKPADP